MNKVERVHLPITAPYILVYIEDYQDGIPSGRFVNIFVEENVSFHGWGDLLLKMDAVYDYLNFPQAAREPRSFFQPVKKEYDRLAPYEKHFYTEKSLAERSRTHKSSLLTFLVKTRFRQSGSWQGSITWLESKGKKKQNFISTLQCLKLMVEALEAVTAASQKGGCI